MFALTVILAAVTAVVPVFNEATISIWMTSTFVKDVPVYVIVESLSPLSDVNVASLIATPVAFVLAGFDSVSVTPAGIPVNVSKT
jgi:hypothetical protein